MTKRKNRLKYIQNKLFNTQNMLNSQIFTTREAAEYLKVSPQAMEKYLREGKVPGKKVGKQWRISQLALDFWLAPSLAAALPRFFLWQEVFALGDKIGREINVSDETILKTVKSLRKKRGLIFKSRSR